MGSPRRTALLALLALLALAFALRVIPLRHGGERGYVPDHHMVRSALGMARDKNPVPPVGRYSTYPNLVPYMLVPAYAAWYAGGVASGEWKDARGFADHLNEHPQHPAWIARALVALFGVATVWAAFRAARAAGLDHGAWIASWLVATGLLHVQFSVHERPWVPMTFFLVLAAWGAIVHVRDGRARALVLSGAAAGLAFASHQAGLGAILLPFFAWLFAPGGWSGGALGRRIGWGFACVAAAGVLALLLGHPYLLVHGATPDAAIAGGSGGDWSVGGQPMTWNVRWEAAPRLLRAVLGYDPVTLLLGLAGVGLAWRVRALRPVLAFLLVWSAVFLTNQSDHVRFFLPVLALLALPAGFAAERWFLPTRGGRVALTVLLMIPLVQAARFAWLLTREDTRAIAERELAELGPGARIAIDRYGPLCDPDRAALILLERVRATLGEPLRERERHRKLALDGGELAGGVDCVRVEELFQVDERPGTVAVREKLSSALGSDPRELLRALGCTHVLLADRRPASGKGSLLAPLFPGETIGTITPGRGGSVPAEAFLPTEMDFPLTGLWSVERPGPSFELRTLR